MSYVYIKSEPQLWTAGFYKPNGLWMSESDHPNEDEAADRVHFLNGGAVSTNPEIIRVLKLTQKNIASMLHMLPIRTPDTDRKSLESWHNQVTDVLSKVIR